MKAEEFKGRAETGCLSQSPSSFLDHGVVVVIIVVVVHIIINIVIVIIIIVVIIIAMNGSHFTTFQHFLRNLSSCW